MPFVLRRLISKKMTRRMLGGVSDSTLDRLRRDPMFPLAIAISKQRIAFDADELEAWIERRRCRALPLSHPMPRRKPKPMSDDVAVPAQGLIPETAAPSPSDP